MRRLVAVSFAFAVALWICVPASRAGAQSRGHPARVLVLYQQQAETQPMLDFTQRLRAELRGELAAPVELYQEALDFDRAAGREHSVPLTGYLVDKYRGLGIDVVVPVGGRALKFATEQLREAFGDSPIVFALCAAPQTDSSTLPPNVTGRLAPASRFAPTIAMARRLQPDAERIVVIGGASHADSTTVTAAVHAVAALRDSLPVERLQGLALDELLSVVRRLPRQSIVIFANFRRDGRGQVFEPVDIIGGIARAASAPMYTQLRNYVGEGVVGGSVTRFDEEGARTGQLVARVLRRRAGERLPPVEVIANAFVVDWRQLRRWQLSETLLPRDTEIVSRELTLWEHYRMQVITAFGVIVAELLLIGSLLIERRSRKRAELFAVEQRRRAEETRAQVAHMGRVALVGELAATISHELRQPLAAIRTNAESGAKLVARGGEASHGSDQVLFEEIFADIIADNERASEIVTRVRALLRREELVHRAVDVNEVCRAVFRLLQHDAMARHAEIVLSLDRQEPIVTGDPIQLEQVLLNLVVNALEASMPSDSRRIVITTIVRERDVELAVRDSGAGFSPEVRQHLFESFFTTKAHGLGLGLVIVQSIVERHQGHIHVDNAADGGAVVRVVMPRARNVGSPTTPALDPFESPSTRLARLLTTRTS